MNCVILAIESSCDESAVAVFKGNIVLAQQVASQIKWHKKFGGVMPELASRMHTEKLNILVAEVMSEAGVKWADLTHVAVTYGPGLEGALLTGLAVAKTLALQLGIPCIGVNHLQGHIYAAFADEEVPEFPFVTLLVSGGHTALIHCKDHFDFEILGQTRDDACGEAFDKVARLVGLSYPGGPAIELAAKEGDTNAFRFPRAMKGQLDFSFSGLKTAVKQAVAAIQTSIDDPQAQIDLAANVSASFQRAVADTLIEKCLAACDVSGAKSVVFSGGVAANQYLREILMVELKAQGVNLLVPSPKICTDNAVMIGMAAYYALLSGHCTSVSELSVKPGLHLSQGCVVV